MEVSPRTITIAFEENFDGLEKLHFDFIEEKSERIVNGVKISDDVQLEED